MTTSRQPESLSDQQTMFHLRQLASAAASAVHFARWLESMYHNPDAPLATLRRVLSPSAGELDGLPHEERKDPLATRAEVTSLGLV